MQSYHAHKLYDSEEEIELLVSSNRCQYKVWISEGEVSLAGPGVDESEDIGADPRFEDVEDFALYIVLMFENGLWPRREN